MAEAFSSVWNERTRIMLIVAAALLFVTPIFFNGIPKGNDLIQHYQFAFTFDNSIRSGDFYPALSASVNGGYGDVGVRFYPPLSYYVLVMFKSLAGTWFIGSVAAIAFWAFLGGLGVYLLCREQTGPAASLSAAVLYIFLPYHANEIYNASFYAEFAAAGVLPFCVFFADRVCGRGKWADVVGLAAGYAFLVLTHLPTALIGSVSLVVFSLFSIRKKGAVRTIVRLASAAALGLAASSFYWVPMVSELPFVNHAGAPFIQSAYDFRANFFGAYFSVSEADYESRSLWFGDLVLVTTVAVAIPAAILYFRSAAPRARLRPFVTLFATAIFLATPLSSAVWERFDLLQKIQFPFRWMTVVSLTAAVLVGLGFEPMVAAFRSQLRPVGIIAIGGTAAVLVFTAAQVIRPAIYIERDGFETTVRGIAASPSCECWWPVWAKKEAFLGADLPSAPGREVSVERWDVYVKTVTVSPGAAVPMRFPLFYYPRWRATSGGGSAPVTMDENGAVVVSIPSGSTKVELSFVEPEFYFYFSLLAGLAWAAIACALILIRVLKILPLA